MEEPPAAADASRELAVLLSELRGRVGADASEAQAQVDRLLEALPAVGFDLELQVVLRRIVELATSLVDARYGALGVVDESGEELVQFITVGVDEQTAARIGRPPTGHGVLGELIRAPRPLRLAELSEHPVSSGFPAAHPPMHSFLGVPVRVGPVVFGNLYLTEKRGGADFTHDDETVVEALAAAAGVAVRNARLYEQSRRRGAWMEAGREISMALLSGTDREDVLTLVVDRARGVLGADLTVVLLADGDGIQVDAASGAAGGAELPDLTAPLREVLQNGEARDFSIGDLHGVAVPLGPSGKACPRALTALWSHRPHAWAVTDLTGFAAHAAVALELAEHRSSAEEVALMHDRDRIGRDLHDLVIQRLFAVGLQLQGAVRMSTADPEQARTRVNRAVDELDGTIRELRSTIYGLQAPVHGRPSLRAQLLESMSAATELLGFAPTLRLDGLLDTLATPTIAEHSLAMLREALSNVARHAHAGRVDVLVAVRGSTFQVRVDDDGVGVPAGASRSGLRNLASRAEQLGGFLRISAAPGGGTRLLWQVPI
jgi:signal transduction histidine kinase